MTSPAAPQQIEPDDKTVIDFLLHKNADLTRELAQTWAGLQQTHHRASAAEQRAADLERLLAELQSERAT